MAADGNLGSNPRREVILFYVRVGIALGALSQAEPPGSRAHLDQATKEPGAGILPQSNRSKERSKSNLEAMTNIEEYASLKNLHEKFAQLVASGMTAQAAFTQAGYPSPQNAPRLRNNALVSRRIEELQARNERKAEMAALSRDELIEILTEIVHATRARLLEGLARVMA